MSNEIEAIKDPGLPAHKLRQTDIDPKAADRAERQVAILFLLSALSTVLFIYAYFFISTETFVFIPLMGDQNLHQLLLGVGLAFSLLFIGLGAVHWAKTLMPDTEVIAHRHEFRSSDADRDDFIKTARRAQPLQG